jgi:hypothetical protein
MKMPPCPSLLMALILAAPLSASGRLIAANASSGSLVSIPWEQVSEQLEPQQRYGLAIVLPDSGNHQAILQACTRFVQSDQYTIKEMLSVPVWFCINRQALKKVVKDLSIKENVVVLNAKGERMAATHIEWGLDSGSAKLRNLLFDVEGMLLAWSESSIRSTDEQAGAVRAALSGLDAERSRDRRDARNLLARYLPRILPALVKQRQVTESVEVREACKALIEKCFGEALNIQGYLAGQGPHQHFEGLEKRFRGKIQLDL